MIAWVCLSGSGFVLVPFGAASGFGCPTILLNLSTNDITEGVGVVVVGWVFGLIFGSLFYSVSIRMFVLSSGAILN